MMPDSPPGTDPEPQPESTDVLLSQHHSLKYSLLGPSLTKPGQDGVDQTKVSEIIYNASKGSKFFDHEEHRDRNLTSKISSILDKKRQLELIESQGGLKTEIRRADEYVAALECSRDLDQVIVHIDCDAFYAAVEELDHPELRDVPFAVGMGVLTTCNYHARRFGCRSGMAGFVADKLCPQLIHIPLNFTKYTAKATEVRAVLVQFDPRFESASIDEAYLNLTQYCNDHDISPDEAVENLRAQVYAETSITVSAGIAANAKLAKICSNQNKPNGQFRLPSNRQDILAFMRDLPVRKVNGVGRVFERELEAIGIKTCGDIYRLRHFLARLFGEKAFQFLLGTYLGLGRTDVRPAEEHERKSVGTESTFRDLSDPKLLRDKLRWTADELEKDLKRTEFKGRTLVLKVKLHTFEVISRQIQPGTAIQKADDLYRYSLPLLGKIEKDNPGLKLRLLGLRCTSLISTKKGGLDFFGRSRQPQRDSKEGSVQIEVDEDGWQRLPDAEFEDAARVEREDDAAELERQSEEQSGEWQAMEPEQASDYRRYGNGFAWRSFLEQEQQNAPEEAPDEPPDQWICPVCALSQRRDQKLFNEHIDLCLSRQTIKEMVKRTDEETKMAMTVQRTKATGRKRRGNGSPERVHKKSFFK